MRVRVQGLGKMKRIEHQDNIKCHSDLRESDFKLKPALSVTQPSI